MGWIGTDMVAVACILGGASAGAAATLALVAESHPRHSECVVDAGADAHQIVITGSSGARSVVVTPKVRVHAMGSAHECEAAIGTESMLIQLDDQLKHLDELDLQLESMGEALELQMNDLDRAVQIHLVDGADAPSPELEKGIEAEIRRKLEAKIRR